MSGVYAIATGSIVLGLAEIIVSLAVTGSVVARRLYRISRDRPVPIIAVVFFGVVALLIAVVQVSRLRGAEVMQLGEVYVPDLVNAISAVGYLILTAVFLWRLAASIRGRNAS
jgi:amino acid transporter